MGDSNMIKVIILQWNLFQFYHNWAIQRDIASKLFAFSKCQSLQQYYQLLRRSCQRWWSDWHFMNTAIPSGVSSSQVSANAADGG